MDCKLAARPRDSRDFPRGDGVQDADLEPLLKENRLDDENAKSKVTFAGDLLDNRCDWVYADRFLPSRKTISSAKDLFRGEVDWEEGECEDELTLRDVYRWEVLGEQRISTNEIKSQPEIQLPKSQSVLQFANDEYAAENVALSSDPCYPLPPNPVISCRSSSKLLELKSKKKARRQVSKAPLKVLDAPALVDDFYLNIVDWSIANNLAVGLGSNAYLWNAGNSKVVKLTDLGRTDTVTATSCAPCSNILAIGTHSGMIQIWDCARQRLTKTLTGHEGRVGVIAWNSVNQVASGSRDRTVRVWDVREGEASQVLTGHRQEVCGLKWSPDQQQLASGGNDNRLNIWSQHSAQPTFALAKHCAAVKALAWSPHQHGLLASGGGTADRTIRLWNSQTGEETKVVSVGSQVCNLMFGRTVNELVSTHGYSLNEINLWRMPSMEKLETLTGHSYRVLYLAMSPDSTTIVTGAGDETLRFWNIFPSGEEHESSTSKLSLQNFCLR